MLDVKVDRIRGMIDAPLSLEGIQQGIDLAKRIKEKGGIDKIITSPLKRARRTAELIVERNPGSRIVYATPRLHPWHLGGLEGQSSELVSPTIKHYVQHPHVKVPGVGSISLVPGESFNDYLRRFLPFVEGILRTSSPHERILLLGHYRNVKTLSSWKGIGNYSVDADKMTEWPDNLGTGSLFLIEMNGDKNKVSIKKDDTKDPMRWGVVYFGRHGATELNGDNNTRTQS